MLPSLAVSPILLRFVARLVLMQGHGIEKHLFRLAVLVYYTKGSVWRNAEREGPLVVSCSWYRPNEGRRWLISLL